MCIRRNTIPARTEWLAIRGNAQTAFVQRLRLERLGKMVYGFSPTPKTGVLFVMQEAARLGYTPEDPQWSNLGQGAPETKQLPGSPERLNSIPVTSPTSEYAPVAGLQALREAVADLYNRRYRTSKTSQYGPENVSISPGGRSALTRIAAVLDKVNLGHNLPDYTAYEELLDLFRGFTPIPVLAPECKLPSTDALKTEIVGRGLGALLLSNPCNPTGDLLAGETLGEWLEIAREFHCSMIFDEFYAHYIYRNSPPSGAANSAAAFVEDVNSDPVLIVDGLTKNWRYPGLRLSWTVGPAETIEAITSAGSFLDGGAAHPIQQAALSLLSFDNAQQESLAIQKEFQQKRDFMIQKVEEMGLQLGIKPRGGFYCFASLDNLPPHLRSGDNFFKEALKQKVITVPGHFFDVNPGQRRSHLPSRLENYVRLSFGPSMTEIERGLDRLKELCAN